MTKENATDSFRPIVKIKDIEDFRLEGEPSIVGDRRDGKLYQYSQRSKLAINVALATGRPLLILGTTGCGKSTLAFNLARVMQRRYYEFVVTSRSQARDLFYRFDSLRRLGDSQLGSSARLGVGGIDDLLWRTQFPYIEPGPLWWSLDRLGASRRGCCTDGDPGFPLAVDPAVWQPAGIPDRGSILLIDEIDKAEPDFPNNLLVPLGSWQFTVEEIARTILAESVPKNGDVDLHPLVIITSNQQRELPDTFLRRCVVLVVPPPTPDELVNLATTTFGPRTDQLYAHVAKRLVELHGNHQSAAEFLDAVQAIQRLKASDAVQAEIIELGSWRSVEP